MPGRHRRPTGGPLLLYLQGAGRTASGHRRGRRVGHHQRRVLALRPGQVAGSAEPDGQLRPALGRAVDARDGRSRRRPRTGRSSTIRRSPRTARSRVSGSSCSRESAWRGTSRATASRSCARAPGVYYARQNMLSQVGSVTTNGMQQQTIFASTGNLLAFGAPTPTWPNIVTPDAVAGRRVPALQRRPRLRSRLQEPVRCYAFNVAYEQRAGDGLGRLRRLHLERRATISRASSTTTAAGRCAARMAPARGTATPTREALGAAARRGHGHQQPRLIALPRADPGRAEAASRTGSSSKATTCWPRTKTTTRTSAIRSPTAASTSSTCRRTAAPRIATSGTSSTSSPTS